MTLKPGDIVKHRFDNTNIGIVVTNPFYNEGRDLVVTVQWDGYDQKGFDHTVDTLYIVREPNDILKEIL